MRRALITLIVVAVALGTHVAAHDTKPEIRDAPDSLRAELYRVVQSYLEAANHSDAATMMAMVVHDPRVSTIANGQVTTGWEAIKSHVLAINAVPADMHVSLSGDSQQLQLTPTLVLFIAPYTLSVTVPDRSVTLHAAMTLLLQKTDGQWRIFHEHDSAMPPGESASPGSNR